MAESLFEELKRYTRFGADDERALRALGPVAEPHLQRIAAEFYERLMEHADARAVLEGPEQVERLKGTLVEWMQTLLRGPWDDAYYQRRTRIGRTHVRIGLPDRYMFGAMNLIRLALAEIAETAYAGDPKARAAAARALSRILDLELAIMLNAYGEAFVEKVQRLERLEKESLAGKLALSEARYGEIVEKGEALIATADAAGRLVLFNRRCEELTGLSRDQVRGRSWMDLLAHEADREALGALSREVLQGKRAPPYEGPVLAPGGVRRRVRWHFTTLPSAEGPLLCLIGMDVTEEREIEERARRAERLASLGTMAAGLAHEVRNPLNAAHLQLALLTRRLSRKDPDVPGALEAAGLVSSEMKRLAGLVEEFLQFARPQPLRLAPSDLRSAVEGVVQLVQPEATALGVELTFGASPKSLIAVVDEERIRQVAMNLIRNAVEATGRGGRVHVAVEPRDRSASLTVQDDGPGLPAPDAPIFEPFYTTKQGGTGLGLAIVHRIVSDHGGRIAVESRPGRTVFSVTLPLQG